MAFSLTEMFARHDIDDMPIEAIKFVHPQFDNKDWPVNPDTYRFTNQPVNQVLLEPWGAQRTWVSAPFQTKIPTRDTGLGSEIHISLPFTDIAIHTELMRALNREPQTPIGFAYALYVAPRTLPAMRLRLVASEIVAANSMLQVVARRQDLLNREFPNVYYEAKAFPGLDR